MSHTGRFRSGRIIWWIAAGTLIAGVMCLSACDTINRSLDTTPDDSRFFTDPQGRVLILHGANVAGSAKTSPDRMPDISEDEVHLLSREWGFNFVRYLLSWDGAEPQPYAYDETYFQGVEKRLDWFNDAGIHVMLDMHQDVYSIFTCGNGAPEWAVRTDGIPLEPACRPVWSFNYFQAAVTRAFDNFWAYDQGAHSDLQEHFMAMWRTVAARFQDHPAVIGYDILNEPYPGSYFDKLEAALRRSPKDGAPSAAFDVDRFAPFYQRVIDAIREVDDLHWIFFEPRFGAPGNGSPSWIPRLNDPRPGTARIAYAPHLYSVLAEATNMYLSSNETVMAWERERITDVQRQDCPLVIGEFGFPWSMTNAARYMTDILDMADRMLAGWAYWPWDPGGPAGWAFYDRATKTPNPNSDYLARPYPKRIAGQPVSFSFNTENRVFELVFTGRRDVNGSTEIYLGAHRHYPDGWRVESSDAQGTWSSSWDESNEVLTVTTPADGAEHRLRILPAGR